MKSLTNYHFYLFTFVCMLFVCCGSGTQNKEESPGSAEIVEEIEISEPQKGIWRPQSFPIDVPFIIKGDRVAKYWKIESITCTGKNKSGNGYDFFIKGVGLESTAALSAGMKLVTICPKLVGEEGLVDFFKTAHPLPETNKGEPFEQKMVCLYDGYYMPDNFDGFIITN